MAVVVLKSKAEIKNAREELDQRRLSFTAPTWRQVLSALGMSRTIQVGDILKSWDVLRTVEFLEAYVPRDAAILDIGAFASELPCILHNLGYSSLVGVDLNPKIKGMPFATSVRYEVSDFTNTSFPNASFQAITAISVVEHGFNSTLLLKEISRLLRPSGFFIASFDYWPEKISSDGVKIFGMDWKIFSADEVHTFIRDASAQGLEPSGKIDLGALEKPIRHAKRDYTFAWMALRKTQHSTGQDETTSLAHSYGSSA